MLVHVWSPLWAFVAGGNYGLFLKTVWFRGFAASLLRAAVPALETVIVCQRVPVLRAGLCALGFLCVLFTGHALSQLWGWFAAGNYGLFFLSFGPLCFHI